MQVPVDVIDIVSGARSEDPEKLDFLCLSLKAIGLINNVVVVENPQIPGRYRMVAGRRRLAAHKKLGWEMIEATVRTLSDVDCELLEISENLARLDYTAIERADAMTRYVHLYAAAHPEVREYMESVKVSNLRVGESDALPVNEGPPGPTAIESVAKKFGTTARSVQREVKRATAFTDEEKLVLRDRDLPQRQIDDLARLDKGDKVQVVNLLGAGMNYNGAMKEVLGDRFQEEGDDDEGLSDEEFLNSCPARAKSNRARFDADALLYRSVQKQKVALGRAIGWSAIKARVGDMGPFARRLLLFMDAKHPRDWVRCSNCVRGVPSFGEVCGHCKGGGYVIG